MTYRARLDVCQSKMNKYVHNVLRGGIAPYPNGYSKRVNVSRLLSLEADVARSTYAYVYAHIECAWSSNVFVFLSLHMHMFVYIKLIQIAKKNPLSLYLLMFLGHLLFFFSRRVHPLQWESTGPTKSSPLMCTDLSWLWHGQKLFWSRCPLVLTSLNFRNAPNPCWF